jgi:HD-GYP domain-containing protein (c-di-GMP phosphodiesterase class II)
MSVEALIKDEVQDAFARIAERWEALGVWCAQWDSEGALLGPVPQSNGLWRALWQNHCRFRDAMSDAVMSESLSASEGVLGFGGVEVAVFKFMMSDRSMRFVTVCFLEQHPAFDEHLCRLCSEAGLDRQVMERVIGAHARFPQGQADTLKGILADELNVRQRRCADQHEIGEMTSQLGAAYEELNLIYRISASMGVTQGPRVHFENMFDSLSQSTPFTTMAVVLTNEDILDESDRLIIGGEPILQKDDLETIIKALPPFDLDKPDPIIVNEAGGYAGLRRCQPWLERLLAIPIVVNRVLLGTVLIINRQGEEDFTSIDARLIQSVVDRSAVYLENVLLYADLNRLLVGLTHALVNSIDAKDPYTCGHSNRVAFISKRIAQQIGATPTRAERVYLSALLHDVGKIGVPEHILCKPGRLTDEEVLGMRRHPEIGAKILGGIKQLDDIIPGVLYHHEALNGRGYPGGLRGNEIPWVAKIICVADSFDAMTSGRTYRSALPLAAAMAEIRRFSGTQFDPQMADALIALIEEGLADDLLHINSTPIHFNAQVSWRRDEAESSLEFLKS